MRKASVFVVSMVTAGIAGVGMYIFNSPSVRQKLKKVFRKQGSTPRQNVTRLPIEKAGQPDPENFPDNQMVSEGAQFGVQYYNRLGRNEANHRGQMMDEKER